MKNNRRLIVIDGLDGSGKSTQFELLKNRLDSLSVPCKPISLRITQGYS